jgi:hypothetical protein
MNKARRSILPWLLLAAATAATAASASPQVQMRRLARGMTTEATDGNAFMVIHTSDDLARALAQKTNLSSVDGSADGRPKIDFDSETAVGVMLSNRPTGCTGVEITSVTLDGIVSVVHYRERKRKPHESCAASVTSPFDFVAIPKTSAPIRFEADVAP